MATCSEPDTTNNATVSRQNVSCHSVQLSINIAILISNLCLCLISFIFLSY